MPTSEPSSYRPGDVVVVPFPYRDRFAEKRRPALVVSNDELAAEGFVWVAMITSAKNSRMRHDQPISDLPRAGLSTPSVVRPIKLACIEPTRIVRRSGCLPPSDSQRALAAVSGFIGKGSGRKPNP
ncbi:MAG: type II toxin-antitoxin system PemK/MazF family toxin [Deltaproteobacteria bacterium]|nr:type II toxin-antitoxin system PemK/MazF family toxin [Deltaproteobacteria bacterium]